VVVSLRNKVIVINGISALDAGKRRVPVVAHLKETAFYFDEKIGNSERLAENTLDVWCAEPVDHISVYATYGRGKRRGKN
jgi:hypothetical protein